MSSERIPLEGRIVWMFELNSNLAAEKLLMIITKGDDQKFHATKVGEEQYEEVLSESEELGLKTRRVEQFYLLDWSHQDIRGGGD